LGITRRASVAARLQELEFEFENLEGSTIIVSHGDLGRSMAASVTVVCGPSHAAR
jgi:hypothetical protein